MTDMRMNERTNETTIKAMEDIIIESNATDEEKKRLLDKILRLKNKKLNIMITGATGSGKSSTINALFNTEVAKVGVGVAPETMDIEKYELGNMTLWDTPGLGDGKEADNKHARNIIKKLNEVDKEGNALIDVVLVVVDGSTRDLGTTYELINQVIIPNLGEEMKNRILVAVNQADVAMKGRYWNYEKNEPEEKLKEFLEEKIKSIKNRVKEATGVEVNPIYYCAGYKEEGGEQSKPYNLSKLLYYIVQATPFEKRAVYVDNINNDKQMWEDDDELIDYIKETKNSIYQSIVEGAQLGAEIGGEIGAMLLGEVGRKVGRIAGTVLGGLGGAVLDVLGGWI